MSEGAGSEVSADTVAGGVGRTTKRVAASKAAETVTDNVRDFRMVVQHPRELFVFDVISENLVDLDWNRFLNIPYGIDITAS